MRISYQGWSRDHGEKDILDSRKLDKDNIKDDISTYDKGKTYITKHYNTSGKPFIKISAYANIVCNGNYLVDLRLSESDIDLLFSIITKDAKYADVCKRYLDL